MTEPIRYRVDLARRLQHLITVTMTVPRDLAPGARLVLPVWTPGSYVVRDYVHHLQRITASGTGGDLPLRPDGRSAWQLPDRPGGPVDVVLELYGNHLSVRTNHVDDHHALLVAPATFPFVDGAGARPHEVRVEAPAGWRVWSLLPDRDGVFVADDYDHLADSAFEAGDHREVTFDVAGVAHRFVWAGHGGRPDLDRIAVDARDLCEAAVDLMGELPAERYAFFVLAWEQSSGGLEHRDGAVLQVPVHGLADAEGYHGFQSLLTHEYLHQWNGKRLTPVALRRLDYERPVHTESLWVVEGWTSYYDELLPVRAGVWTPVTYLRRLAGAVQEVLDRPGRALQSVRRASHEAWTKHYVRDENTPNVGVSYYVHGSVLAWCLDLLIRRERPDSDGLDEVLRRMWKRHQSGGYEEADVETAASEVASCDLGWFFAGHVGGMATPPVAELVEVVGLRFVDEPGDEPPTPDLGVLTAEDDRGVRLTSVLRDRPGWQAGLTGGDRLLAIDGTRVRRGDLKKALLGYRPGDTVEVAVLRGPRLITAEVTLGQPRLTRKLQAVKAPTYLQRQLFRRWTGQALPAR